MSKEIYQLFKGELRGLIQGLQRRSFVTFNQENYFDESRKPIEPFTQFSEHYLYESRQLEIMSESASLILLPIEGELSIQTGETNRTISPQQILVLSPNQLIHIGNCLPLETSRFYTLQIIDDTLETGIYSFHLTERNELIPLLESGVFQLNLGLYDGRKEGVQPVNEKKHLFISIINGVFEVQNRLMETNDSLLAINASEIEFEALSENAIILSLAF
ncbi:hypothetical protein [Fluviicola taffensis]|uniref:hypothetical protein n=1 Tax=Fluviicola taffensis TaxID=191579 RepID=UPI003137D99A